MPDAAAVDVLGISFKMFANERDYPTPLRRGIGERVCCTLLKECSRTALVDFFVGHVVETMQIIEMKLTRVRIFALYMYMYVLYIVASIVKELILILSINLKRSNSCASVHNLLYIVY